MQWPILAGIPEEDARQVLSIARRRTFARREVVFHHGDPADSLHLVHSGRFAVRIQTPLGDTVMLSLLGPGEAFGEIALLDGVGPRSATVVALEKAETRAIHKIDFDALVSAIPAWPTCSPARSPCACGACRSCCSRPTTSPPTAACCGAWRSSASPRASCR
jgi:CRP-like cAMP-binding protein